MTDMRYTIEVDAARADAELARLHKSATTAAGAEDRLAASTRAADVALAEQAATTAKASAATETLQQRVGKWPDLLGKQAAAISLVSSSLGDQNGAVGKAVAGAGQMAAAYGAGGPFALALVGGMALVGALTQHFESMREKADSASARAADAIHKVASAARASDEALRESQKSLTEALRIGEKEAVTFQRALKETAEAGQKRVEEAQRRLDKLKATAIDLKRVEEDAADMGKTINQSMAMHRELRENQLRIAERAVQKEEQALKLSTSALVVAEKRTKAVEDRTAAKERQTNELERQLAVSDRIAASMRQVNEEIETSTDEISRTMRGLKGVEGGGLGDVLGLVNDDDILTVSTKQSELLQMERDFQSSLAAIRTEFAEEEAREREQLRAAEFAMIESYASAFLGIFASAGGDLIDDLIGKQDDALAKFGISIMKSAGTFVVGEGIKTTAAGIAKFLVSGGTDPSAGPAMVGGAAMVGVGMSMGGIATGLAGQLLGMGGGSGGPSERGAPSSFSGGATASGGPTQITVVYSTDDRAARALVDVQARAQDRNLNRNEVR